jgi:hypothetical protein
MNFSGAVIAGIPLILVILGLVSFVKSMGVYGRWLTAISLIFGVVFGILFQLSERSPVNFTEWFAVVVYGLGLGLVTSGMYDQVTEWITDQRPMTKDEGPVTKDEGPTQVYSDLMTKIYGTRTLSTKKEGEKQVEI